MLSTGAVVGWNTIEDIPPLVEDLSGLFGGNEQSPSDKICEELRQRLEREADRNDKQNQQFLAKLKENDENTKKEIERFKQEEAKRAKEVEEMTAKREKELVKLMEENKAKSEEQQRAMHEKFQRETAALIKKHENDRLFNQQLLEGVLAKNKLEVEGINKEYQEYNDKMQLNLAQKNKEVNAVKQQAINSTLKYDKEKSAEREAQAQRRVESENQRNAEIQALNSSALSETMKIMDASEKSKQQLHSQFEKANEKAWEERKHDIAKRDEFIQNAEIKRENIKKRNEEQKKIHMKERQELMAQQRRETKELFEKLKADNEKYKLDEIDRIAEETKSLLRIVDADFQRVKRNAIEAIQQNFCKDFIQILSRMQTVESVMAHLIVFIDPNSEVYPLDLTGYQTDYTIESSVLDRQMTALRGKLKMSNDVSDEFSAALMTPIDEFDASYSSVKTVPTMLMVASRTHNMKPLASARANLESHLAVVGRTIQKMKCLDLKSYVRNAMTAEAKKSISN